MLAYLIGSQRDVELVDVDDRQVVVWHVIYPEVVLVVRVVLSLAARSYHLTVLGSVGFSGFARRPG